MTAVQSKSDIKGRKLSLRFTVNAPKIKPFIDSLTRISDRVTFFFFPDRIIMQASANREAETGRKYAIKVQLHSKCFKHYRCKYRGMAVDVRSDSLRRNTFPGRRSLTVQYEGTSSGRMLIVENEPKIIEASRCLDKEIDLNLPRIDARVTLRTLDLLRAIESCALVADVFMMKIEAKRVLIKSEACECICWRTFGIDNETLDKKRIVKAFYHTDSYPILRLLSAISKHVTVEYGENLPLHLTCEAESHEEHAEAWISPEES